MSKTLLIVHHTPSPHCQEMFEAVVAGATDPDIEGVEVVRRPALTVSPVEMLEADGYLLGTPANLGYISGALKHAFDCRLLPAARLHPWPTVRRLPPRQRGHRGSRARRRRHHRRARLGEGCGDRCGDGQADQGRRRGVLEPRRDGRRAADGLNCSTPIWVLETGWVPECKVMRARRRRGSRRLWPGGAGLVR